MNRNTKAFFKEFYNLKADITKDKSREKYSNEVHYFFQLLDKYMLSYAWSTRDIEVAIFNDYNNYKDKDLADKLGLTISNYRVILNRLTLRLNSLLFFGDDIPTVISDDEIVLEAIDNIKQLLNRVDLDKEFNKDFLDMYVKHYEETPDLDDNSIKVALLFLVFNNKQVKDRVKDFLDTDSISKLVSNINELGYGNTYNKLKRSFLKAQTVEDITKILIDYLGINQ